MRIFFLPLNLCQSVLLFQERYLGNIYIEKNIIKYGDPTYVETFMDPIRMIQIFMDFCAIDNNDKKCSHVGDNISNW